MTEKFDVRCNKCGNVMRVDPKLAGTTGKCTKCDVSIDFPQSPPKARKIGREYIKESELSTKLPDSLTKPQESPIYRIMYTEASPVNFALKRTEFVPLLDLSEGGFGFICKNDKTASNLIPGELIPVQLDFPIFEQPISLKVEVRWVQEMSNEKLIRVGVKFYQMNTELQMILDRLFNYVTSRPEIWGYEE